MERLVKIFGLLVISGALTTGGYAQNPTPREVNIRAGSAGSAGVATSGSGAGARLNTGSASLGGLATSGGQTSGYQGFSGPSSDTTLGRSGDIDREMAARTNRLSNAELEKYLLSIDFLEYEQDFIDDYANGLDYNINLDDNYTFGVAYDPSTTNYSDSYGGSLSNEDVGLLIRALAAAQQVLRSSGRNNETKGRTARRLNSSTFRNVRLGQVPLHTPYVSIYEFNGESGAPEVQVHFIQYLPPSLNDNEFGDINFVFGAVAIDNLGRGSGRVIALVSDSIAAEDVYESSQRENLLDDRLPTGQRGLFNDAAPEVSSDGQNFARVPRKGLGADPLSDYASEIGQSLSGSAQRIIDGVAGGIGASGSGSTGGSASAVTDFIDGATDSILDSIQQVLEPSSDNGKPFDTGDDD